MDKNFSIKKTNSNLQAGYVWMPYILVPTTTTLINEGFSPSQVLSSRYGQVVVSSKSVRRKERITDVLASII